ncbi:MAG: fused MFS/spermidine synthase, partial [Roseburia sp.]|nr:fused MFS/spermidine synthase [Roseburia sp.]
YQDITIPFQMSSVEFFTLVKEHLNENGVMVVNMNMHSEAEGNINAYLSDTIATVFDHVYTVDVWGSTNRELFATQNPQALAVFEAGREKVEDQELAGMLGRVSENIMPYEKGGYLLTDDKAPVELLGMQVIDDLIETELVYYKDLFKREGIKGLLQ